MHPHYNTTNFPIFVCAHGNWDIFRNADFYCASIPAKDAPAGCKATHFGDKDYTRVTLGINWEKLEVGPHG